eukprot:746932-Hanusia_phi.AAC.1
MPSASSEPTPRASRSPLANPLPGRTRAPAALQAATRSSCAGSSPQRHILGRRRWRRHAAPCPGCVEPAGS